MMASRGHSKNIQKKGRLIDIALLEVGALNLGTWRSLLLIQDMYFCLSCSSPQ